MPYLIVKRKRKFFVHKEGAPGRPVGKAHGSFKTREDAEGQLRALYARVNEAVDADAMRLLDRATPAGRLDDALKLGRGKPLDEAITKGSLEYVASRIRAAFYEQFKDEFKSDSEATRNAGYEIQMPWLCEIFADYVIASDSTELDEDEFYKIAYAEANGAYTFAPSTDWEIVELTYTPATPASSSVDPTGLGESAPNKKPKGKRIIEQRVGDGMVVLEESDGAGSARKLRVARAMSANIVNGNRRRYAPDVLRAAIDELKTHLHESAGQGRLMQVLGEAEHPSDKGNRNSQLLETVVKWNDVRFDGEHVSLHGHILDTSKGRDLAAVIEGGVTPGTSMRGYGESKIVIEDGARIEEVLELHITGFDLVSDPSFTDSQAMLESKNQNQEVEMTLEQLKKLIAEHPELFKGLFEGKLDELGADALKKLEETVRAKLGLGADADLSQALDEAAQAKKTLAAQAHAKVIAEALDAATKDLPYGVALKTQFVEAVKAAKPENAEAVKALVESKRVEYDAIFAQAKLATMGFSNVRVAGPVIERELGVPEFASGAHVFTEALVNRGHARAFDPRKPQTRNELFAAQMLARFDETFKYVKGGGGLIAEAKLLAEAEQTSDLNLPYSASRAIIGAAMAQLVAPSVFDFGVVDTNPTRVYYEQYAADTTVTKTVAMGENLTADLDTWVDTAYKRIVPGTLTAKDHAEAVTYTEGTDYVIDYGNGRFMALTGGAIADSGNVHVGYQYMAIRKGELGVIERGKGQLAYVTLDCVADRLAQQVSSEAIVFSRSQIGWDAVSRTMAMIVEQIRRKTDKDSFYLALASALSVASNIAGTWTAAADPLDDFVAYIGGAKVKVANRYYNPESVVLSVTRSNDVSNWAGFTAAGKFPSADLKENGYVGRLKGLPVFETTEFSDAHALVTNREQVMHRVFQPMTIKGPFPSYDATTAQLIAADQYYAEEINGEVSPIAGKASVVKIA